MKFILVIISSLLIQFQCLGFTKIIIGTTKKIDSIIDIKKDSLNKIQYNFDIQDSTKLNLIGNIIEYYSFNYLNVDSALKFISFYENFISKKNNHTSFKVNLNADYKMIVGEYLNIRLIKAYNLINSNQYKKAYELIQQYEEECKINSNDSIHFYYNVLSYKRRIYSELNDTLLLKKIESKLDDDFKNNSSESQILRFEGIDYMIKNDYKNANISFSKALEIAELENDSFQIPLIIEEFFELRLKEKKYPEALRYLDELEEKKGYKNLKLLAKFYIEQKMYDKYIETLLLAKEEDRYFLQLEIPEYYEKIKKNYSKAIFYYEDKLKEKNLYGWTVVKIYKSLSSCYEKIGNHKESLKFYKEYKTLEDSLSASKISDWKTDYFRQKDSIKHADEILIQQAQNLAKEEQLKSERQRRIGLLVIVGLVLVSLGVVFVQLRKTRVQKVVIEGQHQKLNQSHQEITDSINYAKRIQDALMTSKVYMKDVIPESFIFFQPKDVVSGDFYWVYRSPKGLIYFAVADCTGHGVPGAFMSMIGTSLLNEFIIENNLEDTAEILAKMRKQIIKSLKQERVDADNKDGMDMALCKYDPKKKTVQYSGAYNPLIHISKNEICHIKGDNQPIGLHTGKKLPFTNHKIKVKKGDMLYTYSDGFADQFGGERGKKYMSGKFKKFLLSISEMTTEEQEKLVKEEFTNWMGENEQIDDVCVMGVKVT